MAEEAPERTPAEAALEPLKAQFEDRIVTLKRLGDQYGEYEFVMTSPTEPEWNRFQKDIREAGNDGDKKMAAVKTAALAQIRFPERDAVKTLFSKRPGIAVNFFPILNSLAGIDAEEREKKL